MFLKNFILKYRYIIFVLTAMSSLMSINIFLNMKTVNEIHTLYEIKTVFFNTRNSILDIMDLASEKYELLNIYKANKNDTILKEIIIKEYAFIELYNKLQNDVPLTLKDSAPIMLFKNRKSAINQNNSLNNIEIDELIKFNSSFRREISKVIDIYINKILSLRNEIRKKTNNLYITDLLESVFLIIFTFFVIRFLLKKIKKEKRLTTALQEANNSKNKFFSIIGHDLRNAFFTILGLSERLSNDKKLSEQQKMYVDRIHNSAENTYNLLENLLEWARLQADKITPAPEEFDISETIKTILPLFKINCETKSIEIKNNITDNTIVYADISMIETVLRNLISNAIKFTDKNGWIEIGCNIDKNTITIYIKDSGIGIEKENINKLFRTDYKISTLGTNKEKGTGLGLILCKELIEKNGGQINVESESGRGSKFSISIPITNYRLQIED